MKLTKENIYINLDGKTIEKLTDLYWLLKSNNEEILNDGLDVFIRCYLDRDYKFHFIGNCWSCACSSAAISKTKVTIEQLKEILQPMGTFTPIAMKCNKEQFEAIKPKLKHLKIFMFNKEWNSFYLALFEDGSITNGLTCSSSREVHEEWNEEIFLKACGIEAETLQQKEQRLLEELAEVKQQIKEESKPKINDWVYNKEEDIIYQKSYNIFNRYEKKLTNPELIKLLEQEIK